MLKICLRASERQITYPKSLANTMRKTHKYDVWQIILLPVMKKMISTGKNRSISAYDIEANKLSRLKLKESL